MFLEDLFHLVQGLIRLVRLEIYLQVLLEEAVLVEDLVEEGEEEETSVVEILIMMNCHHP